MTRVRLQSFEEGGSTGQVWKRDTTAAAGGSWAAEGGGGALWSRLTSQVNAPTTSYVSTGLSVAVEAGKKYRINGYLSVSAAVSTTGVGWRLNGPAATDFSLMGQAFTSTTAATFFRQFNALPAEFLATSSAGTTRVPQRFEGFIEPSANGNLTLDIRSEVASSQVSIHTGSHIRVEEIT